MLVLTLTENRRQREPWERAALNQFRSGSVEKALEAFESHGRIERLATLADVRARIVEAWATARSEREEPIMLAARREDVRALNQLARATTKERLTGPTLVVEAAPFQAGDHVMTLRNNRRLDVRNGERGVVQAINVGRRSMTVRMTDRAVELPSTYLEAGHVAHGNAMTVHKAQGVTADRAFVLGTDDLYREMGYVAMSRGRLGNHLYVVGQPTREIEPLHGPSLERTNEELLLAALSTSLAQELASAQINPLASLDDRALVEQWREACTWVESIPLDRSRDVRTGAADAEHLEGVLRAQKARHARELATPRSLRDALARRDERGIDSNRRIMTTGDKLACRQHEPAQRPAERRPKSIDTSPATGRRCPTRRVGC